MGIFRYLIALIVLVGSFAVQAGPRQDHQVTSTADLIELCSVTVDDPVYEAAMGFCLGYIDAALDYHHALTMGAEYDAIACPNTSTNREEVVTVVVEWSSDNQHLVDGEVPVVGVMRAISEEWPCS